MKCRPVKIAKDHNLDVVAKCYHNVFPVYKGVKVSLFHLQQSP